MTEPTLTYDKILKVHKKLMEYNPPTPTLIVSEKMKEEIVKHSKFASCKKCGNTLLNTVTWEIASNCIHCKIGDICE